MLCGRQGEGEPDGQWPVLPEHSQGLIALQGNAARPYGELNPESSSGVQVRWGNHTDPCWSPDLRLHRNPAPLSL